MGKRQVQERLWCNEGQLPDPDLHAGRGRPGDREGLTRTSLTFYHRGNCCFSTDFNLTRIIEHSFIRDTDAITTFKMPKPTPRES